MDYLTCPECGSLVPLNTLKCIHCGATYSLKKEKERKEREKKETAFFIFLLLWFPIYNILPFDFVYSYGIIAIAITPLVLWIIWHLYQQTR